MLLWSRMEEEKVTDDFYPNVIHSQEYKEKLLKELEVRMRIQFELDLRTDPLTKAAYWANLKWKVAEDKRKVIVRVT